MAKWRSAAARRIREFTGKKTVDAAVVEIARRLLVGQDLPPTNLNVVFPRVDIHGCHADAELLTGGELRKADDGFDIVYAPSEPLVRRRFTIAHEIAHAVFERTGPHCPRRGRELEKICDMIAGEILVPHEALKQAARPPIDLSEIRRLARLFQCSFTLMAIRCVAQFPIFGVQFDFGEIVWCAGAENIGLKVPRLQLKKLLMVFDGLDTGHTSYPFELVGQHFSDLTIEWMKTGDERTLCIVRR